MKIGVSILDDESALVTFTPSLLDRLMGEEVEDKTVVRCLDINGGYCWLYDKSGRRVPLVVENAIYCEIARVEWNRFKQKRRKDSVEVAKR